MDNPSAQLLAFLAPRAIAGVERVEGNCYRRTISLDGNPGVVEAIFNNGGVLVKAPPSSPAAIDKVKQIFDLQADPVAIAAHLARDPLLAPLVAREPGLRVPGSWDPFELAVRAILGQQVTVKGASTLAARLVREFGTAISPNKGLTHLFPLPAVLADADLTVIGLPRARAATIRNLAAAVTAGLLDFGSDCSSEFRKLPGIGDWTTQYVALRALGDRDAFPSGDLGLLKASGLRTTRELETRSQTWRPWRAYAAIYLWRSLSVGQNR